MIKTCNKHGETEHTLDSTNRQRCKKCRVDAVIKRRLKLKELALEYKGSKCSICNYNKCVAALEFHHTDNNKEFGIGAKGYTFSWEKVKKELDKCMLLCANCHRELHYKIDNQEVIGSIPI